MVRTITPLRSLLFVPANNWRFIESAKKVANADAIILDLEDAVPIDDKETGRWFLADAIKSLKEYEHNVVVRVNNIEKLIEQDIEFAVQKGLDAIMLPKTESWKDIKKLEELLIEKEKKLGIEGEIGIITLIESAKGVLNVREILASSDRIIAVAFGAADYLRDLGLSYFTLSPDEYELLYPRVQIVLAAREKGVAAIDTPFFGLIIDKEGLAREARIARSLGFTGKLCIHPLHVEIINKIFTPSEKEVTLARKIVDAYEKAKAQGLGATSVEGRMIDEATYRLALNTLKLYESIKIKEQRLRQ